MVAFADHDALDLGLGNLQTNVFGVFDEEAILHLGFGFGKGYLVV